MSLDPIARIRRFNRAVTSEVGALDTSFLGLGRPLGAARVIDAIGKGHAEVSEIRNYLGLDSGLMSRLLRSLEDEGLVETLPHPDDARRRLARLTEEGRRAFASYEALSDARAAAVLEGHSRPDVVLEAMDIVAAALSRKRITLEERGASSPEARYCLAEYYKELSRRFTGGFDVKLSRDPEAKAMTRPLGVFLVAMSDDLPIGCAGLKGDGSPVGEVKRVWVSPAARGLGLGGRMMSAVEAKARELSMTCLRLDTNSALTEALRLYRRDGWREIERFNDDPYPDTFFEKHI